MSHVKKIKEAYPELEHNELIMSLAKDLDTATVFKSLVDSEAGRELITYLRKESRETLSILLGSVEKSEKEKDLMIISLKEKISLLTLIMKTNNDIKELQAIVDEEIKNIIG
jgi:hypothetical protein